MTERSEDEYVSAVEACQFLGVKPATLYAYVSRGLLSSYREGKRRQRRYRRSELDALRNPPSELTDGGHSDLPDAASWVGER